MEQKLDLIDTTRISNSKSLRMSMPRRIAEQLGAGPKDIIGFYLTDEGDVIIKKLR